MAMTMPMYSFRMIGIGAAHGYITPIMRMILNSHTHKCSSRGNTPEALTALNNGGQKTAAFGI